MKMIVTFLVCVAAGTWSQVVFFGLPQTARGWLFFVSVTVAVAAGYALFVGRKTHGGASND